MPKISNLEKIKDLAFVARELAEEFASKFEEPGRDPYNRTTLRCYCAIASYIFYHVAKKHDFTIEVVQGVYDGICYDGDFVDHAWNKYHGNIIDITATQFGIPEKVYILSEKEAKKENKYDPWESGVGRFKFSQWPKSQDPFYEANNKLIKHLLKRKF